MTIDSLPNRPITEEEMIALNEQNYRIIPAAWNVDHSFVYSLLVGSGEYSHHLLAFDATVLEWVRLETYESFPYSETNSRLNDWFSEKPAARELDILDIELVEREGDS